MSFKRTDSFRGGPPIKRTRNVKSRPKATASARVFTSTMPRKLSSGLPRGLAAAVRKVIQNSKEKKIDVILPTASLNAVALESQDAINGPNFYLVVPGPVQGTAQNDRIGNEIGITQSNLNVIIQSGAASSDAGATPCIVTMMIGRLKEGIRIPNDADWVEMFVNSNGLPAPAPNTQLASMNFMVNEDYFDVKLRKQYKVADTVINNLTNSKHNNDFSSYYQESVDISKFMKKKLQYNDDASEPQNEGLYVWFLIHPTDGIAITGLGRPTVVMTMNTRFTDA